MNISKIRENSSNPIYYIMSEQPDCCPKCQARLDLVEIVMVEGENVFVNNCEYWEREILIVED